MSLYKDFQNALSKVENEDTKKKGRGLINVCHEYYLLYQQYQKLNELGNCLDQKKLSEDELSLYDKLVLHLLVDYQKMIIAKSNEEDQREVQTFERQKSELLTAEQREIINENIETLKKRIASRKTNTNMYLLNILSKRKFDEMSENISWVTESLEINDMSESIGQVRKKYIKILFQRIKEAAKTNPDIKTINGKFKLADYEKVIKTYDIYVENIDEYIELYMNSSTQRYSAEEAFNSVLAEEYVNKLIQLLSSTESRYAWLNFHIYTINVISRLSDGITKRKDNAKYFKQNYYLNMEQLKEEIAKKQTEYGKILLPCIDVKDKFSNVLRSVKYGA